MRGEWTFAEAEKRAQYLLSLGKAVPPAQWVTGLLRQGRRGKAGAWLEGFI